MGRRQKKKCSTRGCSHPHNSNGLCAKCDMAVRRYGSVTGKPLIVKRCKTCGRKFKTKRDSAQFCQKRKCYRNDPENKVKQDGYNQTFKENKGST